VSSGEPYKLVNPGTNYSSINQIQYNIINKLPPFSHNLKYELKFQAQLDYQNGRNKMDDTHFTFPPHVSHPFKIHTKETSQAQKPPSLPTLFTIYRPSSSHKTTVAS
jgi:hypothetical protein